MQTDIVTFFRLWLSNPLMVASVVPSSKFLAKLIISQVNPAAGSVLELGPGTGVFTHELIQRGVQIKDLTLVELEPEFAQLLKRRYPSAHILVTDAAYIHNTACDYPTLHAVAISGLPLLSFSPRQVMKALTSIFRVMEDKASLYQFTYGWTCPVPKPVLDRLNLTYVRVGRTFANFPPATVYRIYKKI